MAEPAAGADGGQMLRVWPEALVNPPRLIGISLGVRVAMIDPEG